MILCNVSCEPDINDYLKNNFAAVARFYRVSKK